jgi:hypothetical protein
MMIRDNGDIEPERDRSDCEGMIGSRQGQIRILT